MRADQAVGSGRSARSGALRPEELLVGRRGEVDRERVLDVAVRRLRVLGARRSARTASSSEIGGGSGRLGRARAARRGHDVTDPRGRRSAWPGGAGRGRRR